MASSQRAASRPPWWIVYSERDWNETRDYIVASAEQSWLHTVLLQIFAEINWSSWTLCGLKDFVVRPTMAQHRTYKDECSFIERLNENAFLIKKGFVPNMKVSQFQPKWTSVSPPGAFLQKSFNEVKRIKCKIYTCVIPTSGVLFSWKFVLWKIGLEF